MLSVIFWEAACRKTPTIFTDELEWAQLSRAIADDRSRGAPRRASAVQVALLVPDRAVPGGSHSTATAYAAIKYLERDRDGVGRDPRLLPRAPPRLADAALRSPRSGRCCTSAFFYAPFLLPEVARVPDVLRSCAYLCVPRARRRRAPLDDRGDRRLRSSPSRCAASSCAPAPRSPLAAVVLWLVGPRERRLRAGWSARRPRRARRCSRSAR